MANLVYLDRRIAGLALAMQKLRFFRRQPRVGRQS
jgi:hypothetical protein